MRLEAFKLKNFKCVVDTDWLRIADISLLVGENDSGKTAALEGLSFLFDVGGPSVEDITLKVGMAPDDPANYEEDLEIHGVFSLSAAEQGCWNSPPLRADGRLHVILRLRSDGSRSWSAFGSVPHDEGLRIDLEASGTTRNILLAILTERGENHPASTPKPELVDAVQLLQKASRKVEAESPIGKPPHLAAFRLLDFREAGSPQSVIDATLRERFASIVTGLAANKLKEVEVQARQMLRKEVSGLQAFVTRYRPEITGLDIEIRVDFARGFQGAPLKLQTASGEAFAERRGEGFRRQLTLAAFEWSEGILDSSTNETGTIILFDEPDTHLDYHAQQRLIGVLSRLSDSGCQLVIATHSINMLNTFPLERVNLFSRDASNARSRGRPVVGKASGREGQSEDLQLINSVGRELGIDNAAVLYERCFLLFEGESEDNALPRMYEIWSGNRSYLHGVRFINAYGNVGVLQFTRFLRDQGRAVVGLIDEDTTYNKGTKRLLTESKLWAEGHVKVVHKVRPVCFELAFSSRVWRRAIAGATGRRGPQDNTIDAHRTDANEFVKFLMGEMDVDSKPSLARHLANAIRRPSDIPESIRQAFHEARRNAELSSSGDG